MTQLEHGITMMIISKQNSALVNYPLEYVNHFEFVFTSHMTQCQHIDFMVHLKNFNINNINNASMHYSHTYTYT